MNETRLRSLLRALTWRAVSILLGTGISLIFIKDLELVLKMNVVFVVIGTSVQYAHERVWNRIVWGIEINEEPSRDDEG